MTSCGRALRRCEAPSFQEEHTARIARRGAPFHRNPANGSAWRTVECTFPRVRSVLPRQTLIPHPPGGSTVFENGGNIRKQPNGVASKSAIARPFTPIVFAGLSLSHEEVNSLGFADVRPPVKEGDLHELENGEVVAIVDGELNARTILPNSEIRQAIQRGVKIRGAASLGALRAFEMRDSGMMGCGWVYNAYCTGRISGADEIAVVYEPLSHRSLTIPLVDVRFRLDCLIADQRITGIEADLAMNILKGLSLEERESRIIKRSLGEILGKERVEATGLARQLDWSIKKRDASQLLCTLKTYPQG